MVTITAIPGNLVRFAKAHKTSLALAAASIAVATVSVVRASKEESTDAPIVTVDTDN